MSTLEGLREGCGLCFDILKDWKVILEGTIRWNGEDVHWVVVVVPADRKSVSEGEHFLFTTDKNHVGTDRRAEMDLRNDLILEARRAGRELLGHFRFGLNEGPEVATSDHFHIHLIKPGLNERMLSFLANVPRAIDEAAVSGLISSKAAELIKDKILQKPKK